MYFRKRQQNEQTQTPVTTAMRNGSGNSGSTNQDSDSSRDLLTSSIGISSGNGYRKGTGHQTRLTYDSPFTTLYRTDKFCQVDLDFPYHTKHPANRTQLPDESSANSKETQMGRKGIDKKLPYNYAKPKRGRTIKQKALNSEPTTAHDIQHVSPYEFYSNVTICPVDCSPREVYSTINPTDVHSINLNHNNSPNSNPTRTRDHVTTANKKVKDVGNSRAGIAGNSRETSSLHDRPTYVIDTSHSGPLESTQNHIATFYLNPDPVTCSVSTSVTRTDPDALKKRSLASMPEMSELVIEPENTYSPSIPDFISDESDWETRSTISI